MANALFFPSPINISFIRWASIVTEELSQYNVGIPESEDAWLSWALQVYNVNDLAEEGIPNPNGFITWDSWAARCVDIAQG